MKSFRKSGALCYTDELIARDNPAMVAWLQRHSEDLPPPHLVPYLRSLVSLSIIYHDLLANVFSALTGQSRSIERRLHLLQNIDLDLGHWHAQLDSSLCWNRWETNRNTLETHIVLLQ